MRGAARAGCCLILVGVLCGCASPARPPKTGCPVVPVPSERLPEALALRARLQLESRGREVGLEVVANRVGDDFVIVGLATHGLRLFTVRQHGRELDVDAGDDPGLSYLALFVVDVLHRAYLIETSGTGGSWGEEIVEESRRDGVRTRSFRAPGTESAASQVAIEYPDEFPGQGAGLTEIRNDWCGYEAVVARLDGQ